MRIFAVDENNDLYRGPDGRLAVSTDLQAFSQACEHAMKSILNEMVFCAARGLPYFESVWGETENLRIFEDRARGTLSALPGAVRVTEFSVTMVGDTLRYRATISSVYGPTAINGEVAGNGI